MDAMEYLRQAREKYVDGYRRVLREKREQGLNCQPEVWVDPNAGPESESDESQPPPPPHPLCVDIVVESDERPEMVMVTAGEFMSGARVGTLRAGEVEAKIYPFHWEECPVWVRHPEPDWSMLANWRQRWMNPDAEAVGDDDDGLHGVVHYLGRSMAEGGGHLYQMDFGSAPVEAMTELLEAFARMGVSEIEVGRSDGSDLPADIIEQLRQPELSMNALRDVVTRLMSALPEVARVEAEADDHLLVFAQDDDSDGAAAAAAAGNDNDRDASHVYLGNLFRMLQRTGMEARLPEIHRFIRGQRDSLVPPAPADLSQLRVVIKDNRFLDNIKQQVPGMKPLLSHRLTGDLWGGLRVGCAARDAVRDDRRAGAVRDVAGADAEALAAKLLERTAGG
jgi:hypothetical protein